MYPDELLYSFISRYHTYSVNTSTTYTTKELFEGRRMLATPDLPINLNSIYNSISVFSELGIDELIGNHTFYYYYANFLEHEQREFVRNTMCTGEIKGAIHMKAGVMPSGIKEKEHFYYCKECVSEDIEKVGETYWHLSHQLPGVFICTKHKSFLRESNLEFRSKKRFEFYLASEKIRDHSNTSIKGLKCYEQLSQIASECVYLASKNLNFSLKNVQKIYRNLLLRQGYISGHGRVNQKKLAKDFERFYDQEILNILQSSVSYDSPECWLKSITRKHRKSFHPLRHILLILFLHETLESIEQMKVTDGMPFGKGPYPCLNRAAGHYGELKVNKCEIKVCSKTKLPIGSFKCKCGFYYSRKGPDTIQDDSFRIDRVIQYGEVWVEMVNKLIHEQARSYRSVARQLEVDTKTVIKYSKKDHEYAVKTKNKDNWQREDKKKEWLSLINDNPQYGVTKIRKIKPSLYIWLYRNSKEWLQKNSPKEKRITQHKQRIDWGGRDCEILKEVERVTADLIDREPPVRITVSLIGSEVGKRTILQKHLNKLPLTKSSLMFFVEDIPSFQIRRILFILKKLDEQNQRITEWSVRRKAGLKEDLDIRVEKALKEIIDFQIQE
ncbi:TnsD family transposase [[Bacillus] enclensis]|uniref:TnsD family transposase n=1 Tax=[Bacillus] enclensis TaxID=1402860 RepID=UPI001E63F0DF|nr:TnsD family transposase [[Bacillus] enclensis]